MKKDSKRPILIFLKTSWKWTIQIYIKINQKSDAIHFIYSKINRLRPFKN
jgi:hypothetical protein